MIGDKIRELRKQKGYSQVEFADLLNIKKQTLYKYEMNIVTNIPLDRLSRIARLLGVTPSYLMGWEVNEDIIKSPATRMEAYTQLLNEEGIQKVEDYINDLLESSRYSR